MSASSSALPKVSIGIPTFNRSEYLLEAVKSAMGQTYPNIEIVVSDNASNDDTWQQLTALEDSRLVRIRQTVNIGMTGNFNATLEAATGTFFILLSDDDLLEPAVIEKLMQPFLKSDDGKSSQLVGVSWCPCIIIDSTGKKLWNTAGGPTIETSVDLIEMLWLGHRGPRLASVLERTEDARRVGGYDDIRFGLLCDTGNWGQIALSYPNVACTPEPLVQYRVHPSSGTGNSVCKDWQRWGLNLHAAFVDQLHQRGDLSGQRRIEHLRKPLLANLTVDVLMRGRGTEGWINRTLREFWLSRTYLFTAYCAKRLIRDGSKLFR